MLNNSSTALLTALRIGAGLAFLFAVVSGLVAHELQTKVVLSMLGALVAGALGGIGLRVAATVEPSKMAKVNENVREAQRMLNDISSIWRAGSAPIVNPSSLDLMEMLRHPLFIFTCLTLAVMVWFSSSFAETPSALSSVTPRALGAHVLASLLIMVAVLGTTCKIIMRSNVEH